MAKNKDITWTRLDNAGKIFPPNTTMRDTKVFRFTCELYNNVDPQLLQQALELAVDQYPVYLSVLKKGLFWYYLESSTIRPAVREEYRQPCSPLYIHNKKTLLFEVTYYKKRINLDVYHAISDGTGAMQFLKSLMTHYLILAHPTELKNNLKLFDSTASRTQNMDDSFNRYYSKEDKSKSPKHVRAHIIRAPRLPENRLSVIEGIVPLDKLMAVAKAHNTTLTVLIAAMFLCAVNDTMTIKERKRSVVAVVPVNLRKYFTSESVRNFFGTINVGYNFSDFDGDIDKIISALDKTFKDELTLEQLRGRMNQLSALEHNIFARPAPLFIKDLIMHIAHDISAREKTISISNIGRVTMHEQLEPYVRLFHVHVSTAIIQLCICSFNNNLGMTFSSAYIPTDIQMGFFRQITKLGIPVEINANLLDEDG